MDDADWRDLTAQLEANGKHDEVALVDVDPSVSREDLWRRLRIVALAYREKFVPLDYGRAAALSALLGERNSEILWIRAENSRLRAQVLELLGEVPQGVCEAVKGSLHAERNARIYQMRRDGKTLKAISDAVGVSRERVRQVVAKTERLMRLKAESEHRSP
jgi:DNA-directed RNA polymerase specialized sigma subunit